jgi:hypothetical protein
MILSLSIFVFPIKKPSAKGRFLTVVPPFFPKQLWTLLFPVTAGKPYHLLALPLSGQCSEVIFVWSVQSALTLPISLGNPTIPTLFINTTVGNLIMIYSFRQ